MANVRLYRVPVGKLRYYLAGRPQTRDSGSYCTFVNRGKVYPYSSERQNLRALRKARR